MIKRQQTSGQSRAVARAAFVTTLVGLIALSFASLPAGWAGPAPFQTATPSPSDGKQKLAGCAPQREAGTDELCAVPEIEAWYHITPASEAPVELPRDTAPEESQYPEDTLHVGQKVGEEESRTYLTFDLSTIGLTATITEAVLYLPLDEDGGTADPGSASFKACSVSEPPKKNKQGSVDQPPEAECARTLSSVAASFHKEPRPYFEVDLGPLTDLLTTPGSGIALVPTKTENQRLRSWHLAFYATGNKDKDAEPISLRIIYEESALGGFTTDPLPPSSVGSDSSTGGDDFGSTGGFSSAGFGATGAPPGTAASVEQPGQPLAAAPLDGEPIALRTDPQAYALVWWLPLGLLLAAGFWSHVLNREIRLPLE